MSARIDDFDGKKYVKPRKAIKVMCREIQLGYVAATMAVEQASSLVLPEHDFERDRLAVVFGAETFQGEPEELARAFQAANANGPVSTTSWGRNAFNQIQPLWMLKYLPNMAASHISIALDARGPNNTICQGDVSSALALIEGADLIRRGWADAAVVGGTSSRISPVSMVYRGSKNLNQRFDAPEQAMKPFDSSRDGYVHAEGAAALVLEASRSATFHASRSQARLTGWSRGFCDFASDDFSDAIAAVSRSAMDQAGISISQLGHIHASGFSCQRHDQLESNAIAMLSRTCPVIATKSNMGNPGPSASVLEIVASILALNHQCLPAVYGFSRPDDGMDINVIQSTTSAPIRSFLKIAFADSGQIAALVFEK